MAILRQTATMWVRGSRRSLEEWSLWAGRAVAWVSAGCVAGPFFYHVARGSNAHLGLFEDDYFYYAVVADKLVRLGTLSYDGLTPTNGFHPLWLVVLATLRLLCGRFGAAFHVALAGLFVASMVATYELSLRFARSLGTSALLAPLLAALYSIATDRLLACGMETAVAVPLLLYLFVEVAREEPLTDRRAAKLGFVASMAILARLDIAIAVAIVVVAWLALARPPLNKAWRTALAFCSGGILVVGYAVANLCLFGSVLPVSALAKHLETGPGVNCELLGFVATNTVYGRAIGALLPLGVIAFVVVARRDRRRPRAALLAGGAALLFPFVFYGVNALGGWVFFGWYAYPLAPAIVASLVFLCEAVAPFVRVGAFARAGTVAGGVVLAAISVRAWRYFVMHGPRWSVRDNAILAMGIDLADRVRDRNGVFGMGAMAGFATYMVDKPFVQLEGLVADRAMVEHVRRQDPLEDVLRAYHVDYLVVSVVKTPLPERDGCFTVTEPSAEWAGARALKMTGEICSPPIARFANVRAADPWAAPFSIETVVFDVRAATWRARVD
ncbi:MAG: hypothetical protein M3O50_19555 [Myxococcota bacterium]|nr:hypothetical protein [Myxococcota bacterium]